MKNIKILGREISEVKYEDSLCATSLGIEFMEYGSKREAEFFGLAIGHIVCLMTAYYLSLVPFLKVFTGLSKQLRGIVFFEIPVCAVTIAIVVCRIITNHRFKKTVQENIFSNEKKRRQLMVIALRDFCLQNPACFLKVEEHMVSVRNLKTKRNMDFEVETQVEEDEELSGKMRVVFCDSCVKFFLPAKQEGV